ncbi:NAD(+) synthase [Numidum massiliense]|uniref:NAD(+) synthase n=1 Tax=Numidum massiliense TaxID=1522315 RepID=UPI0006D565FF|nr:NAD(+) synthase [Numidum massiliense]
MEQNIAHVVTWLRERVQAARADGLIVGISGGVDSAVVSFLIKQACPDHSLGVIMPCHSNARDEEDAQKVVAASGIDCVTIDVSAPHRTLQQTVEAQLTAAGKVASRPEIERLRDANLRARVRMATLYTVANDFNYLVVGTDNRAEYYTGYFTKYGDGGVDLQPLARLLKREVYDWARHLGVPESVCNRPPSAGLWEGQEDETEMGTTYAAIDAFLAGEAVAARDRGVIENMHRRTEHKRHTPPIPPPFPKADD